MLLLLPVFHHTINLLLHLRWIFLSLFFSPVLALTLHSFACDAGKGAVYSFDPVGSYQRDTYKAGGSASAMLQPLLDNQVNKTHWHGGCITK